MLENEKNGRIPDLCEICGTGIAMVKSEGLWRCPRCARERAEELVEKSQRIGLEVAKKRELMGL